MLFPARSRQDVDFAPFQFEVHGVVRLDVSKSLRDAAKRNEDPVADCVPAVGHLWHIPTMEHSSRSRRLVTASSATDREAVRTTHALRIMFFAPGVVNGEETMGGSCQEVTTSTGWLALAALPRRTSG